MTGNDLYNELDAITGGLPAFLAVSRDETWKLEPYEPFTLVAAGQTVRFGFWAKLGGDLVPDPQLRVRIDTTARTATVVLCENQFGYWQEPQVPAGTDTYAIDLLREMQRRRAANPDGLAVRAVAYHDGDVVECLNYEPVTA